MAGNGEKSTSARLIALADDIELRLGPAVRVERESLSIPGTLVTITPTRPDALGLTWIELGQEVVLQTADGSGGRWELENSEEDLDLVDEIVSSVIAGRVVEICGPGRSRVMVTLASGKTLRTTVADFPSGCLPIPLWTRWGRRTKFAPYAEVGATDDDFPLS